MGVSPYPSYREGCLAVVNLGADADTTGKVYGQPAGPYHGESDIPPDWHGRLHLHETIGRMAEQGFATRLAESAEAG